MDIQTLPASPHAPTGRESSLVRVGQRVFCFGGLAAVPSSDPQPSNSLHSFDIETRTWSAIAAKGTCPTPRTGFATVALQSRVFLVIGGLDPEVGYLREVHSYDVETETWKKVLASGQAPAPRDKHSCVEYGGKVVMFGGFGLKPPGHKDEDEDDEEDEDEDEDEEEEDDRMHAEFVWFDDVHVLQKAEDDGDERLVWSLLETSGTSPSRRAAHVASCTNETMIVFGGRDITGRRNDLYSLNIETRVWSAIAAKGDVPSARSFHSAVYVEGLGGVFVFGGLDAESKHCSDGYILRDGEWKMVTKSSLPARGNVGVAALGGKQVLLFGGSSKWDAEINMSTELHAETLLVTLD